MHPKKRKSAKASDHKGKRRSIEKDSAAAINTGSDKPLAATGDEVERLHQLYHELIPWASSSSNSRTKHETAPRKTSHVSHSTNLITLVWPALVKAFLSTNQDGVLDSTTLTVTQLSHLAAVLLSLEYMQGDVNEATLQFVQPEHVAVWNEWCRQLFAGLGSTDSQKPHGDDFSLSSLLLTTTSVHCFDIFWTCLAMQPAATMSWQSEQLQPVLLNHVRSMVPRLLPLRYREWFLRRQSPSERFETSQGDETHSFVASSIQLVLRCLELVPDASSPEDTGTSSSEPIQEQQHATWGMFHRVLELLCDILSLASPIDIRECLMVYLDAIHWTVRSRFAMDATSSTQGGRDTSSDPLPLERMRQLARQLLDRVTQWMHNFPMSPIVTTTTSTTIFKRCAIDTTPINFRILFMPAQVSCVWHPLMGRRIYGKPWEG
jgi:hypothetical protein